MSNGDKDGNEIKFDKDGKPIIQIDKPIPKWLQQLLRDVRENKNPHRKKNNYKVKTKFSPKMGGSVEINRKTGEATYTPRFKGTY